MIYGCEVFPIGNFAPVYFVLFLEEYSTPNALPELIQARRMALETSGVFADLYSDNGMEFLLWRQGSFLC